MTITVTLASNPVYGSPTNSITVVDSTGVTIGSTFARPAASTPDGYTGIYTVTNVLGNVITFSPNITFTSSFLPPASIIITVLSKINIGNQVNDGLGDDLRTAFDKVNANFSALSNALTVSAKNLGSVGSVIYKDQVANVLEFKRLVAGRYMEFTDTDVSVLIDSTAPLAFTEIETQSGNVAASSYQAITLQGGADLNVNALGSTITVNANIPITKILTTYDFGYLNPNLFDAVQLLYQAANVDFGTFNNPSTINIDLGTIIPTTINYS